MSENRQGASRAQIFRFGPFELNLRTQELRKHGVRIKLHRASVEVLAALLERPGDVVTREELRGRLWPADLHIEYDDSLNSTVSRLRDALGDSLEEPRYIQTVPRVGYRFVATVEVLALPTSAVASSPEISPPQTARPSGASLHVSQAAQPGAMAKLPRWRTAALVVVAGVLLTGGYFGWREATNPAPGPTEPVALAVLPFYLPEAKEEQILGQVMADDLIHQLSRTTSITVRPSSATYRIKSTDADSATGQQLGATMIVRGESRRIGERFRTTVRMVRARDGATMWSENFEGGDEDFFETQDRIALRVAKAVDSHSDGASTERTASRATRSVAAYGNYLEALAAWNQRNSQGIYQSIDQFELAIAKDPNFALAYAGLASAYAFDLRKWQQAEVAARRALEIDPQLGEAHAALGFIRMYWQRDWESARREFQQAIDLSPRYATAHQWYALFFAAHMFFAEAVAEMRKALELDPYSPAIQADAGHLYYLSGDHKKAIEHCRKALQLEADFINAHICLYKIYRQAGMKSEAAEKLAEIRQRLGREYIEFPSGTWLAEDLAIAGRKREALRLLEQAHTRSELLLVFLKAEPAFRNLTTEPAFADLCRRLALPKGREPTIE